MSSPGVVAIYTSKDIDASLPCGWETPTKPGTPPMHEPPWPVFAKDKIRFVGEMIAVVIAETVNQAKDACELINLEYEDLPRNLPNWLSQDDLNYFVKEFEMHRKSQHYRSLLFQFLLNLFLVYMILIYLHKHFHHYQYLMIHDKIKHVV